jgi:hypothetical protein
MNKKNSSVTPPTPVVDSNKPCPVCSETINSKARKCRHCSSELGWRRFLGLSDTTLAILTALIAVMGSMIPIFKTAFDVDDSNMHAVFMGMGSARSISPQGELMPGSTILLVSNDGNKGGGIVAASFDVRWAVAGKEHMLYVVLRTPHDEPIIIAPGSAVAVRLSNDNRFVLTPGTSATDVKALLQPIPGRGRFSAPLEMTATCSVSIAFANASGKVKDRATSARCQAAHPLLLEMLAASRG